MVPPHTRARLRARLQACRLAEKQESESGPSTTDQGLGMGGLWVSWTRAFCDLQTPEDRQLGVYNSARGTNKRVKDGQESKEEDKHQKMWGRKCRGSGSIGMLRNNQRGRLGQSHTGKRQKEALRKGRDTWLLEIPLRSATTTDNQYIIHHHTPYPILQTTTMPIPAKAPFSGLNLHLHPQTTRGLSATTEHLPCETLDTLFSLNSSASLVRKILS